MSKLFGYNLYLQDRNTLIKELKYKISLGQTSTVISLNTLKLYQGSRSKYLESLFQSGTHIIPDGQSIAFAEYLVNGNKISAISGAELMVELIKEANLGGYKIFFLGSPQELLDRVKIKIEEEYPQLSGNVAFQHGYYDVRQEEEVVNRIAAFEADFLFVAFGSPRKEEFIVKHHQKLKAKVIMGVGGSYEYFVGDVKLDALTKRLGLRWLVRTLQDPRRLAKRYAVCNSYFLYALLREIIYSRTKTASYD